MRRGLPFVWVSEGDLDSLLFGYHIMTFFKSFFVILIRTSVVFCFSVRRTLIAFCLGLKRTLITFCFESKENIDSFLFE